MNVPLSSQCEVEDGVTEYCRGCGKLKRDHPGYPKNQPRNRPENQTKLGVGFLVRTIQDAGSSWVKADPVEIPRTDCAWGVRGQVIKVSLSKMPSKMPSWIYRVHHLSSAYFPEAQRFVNDWYERAELELAITDPHAWLLAGLVLRWNESNARVLADVCEERGNHGAAEALREKLSMRTRLFIEHLAMVVGIKAFDDGVRNTWKSETDYQIGWSHTLDGRPFEDIIGGVTMLPGASAATLITESDGRVMSSVSGRIFDVRHDGATALVYRGTILVSIDNVGAERWAGRPVAEGSVLRATNEDGVPIANVSIYVRFEP